ncbi:MAG: hypothetical protein P8L85_17365, partial [Rubripirellula sp.]|nr:hypothetical protein [Rubripirellula sp.]
NCSSTVSSNPKVKRSATSRLTPSHIIDGSQRRDPLFLNGSIAEIAIYDQTLAAQTFDWASSVLMKKARVHPGKSTGPSRTSSASKTA